MKRKMGKDMKDKLQWNKWTLNIKYAQWKRNILSSKVHLTLKIPLFSHQIGKNYEDIW